MPGIAACTIKTINCQHSRGTLPERHTPWTVQQHKGSVEISIAGTAHATDQASAIPVLADIPVVETGPGFALETLDSHLESAHALLDLATQKIPGSVLRQLDRVSRAWLVRWENLHLSEIDAVAGKLARPGAYFFSINYEWGCTCRVAPAPNGKTARLARVLDWRTPGLGRHILAANVAGKAGPFTALTWPGYTGVLSASAPGRFAAALNQAPMRRATRHFVLDWAANRRRVWNMGHPTPSHMLRHVLETAPDFRRACDILTHRPISTPAIFILAGVRAEDTAVIERTETEAHVYRGAGVAANHWQAPGWRGRPRGHDSAGRAAQIHRVTLEFGADFGWAKPPILNERTRMIMIADAAEGAVMAQGFELAKPATKVLRLGLT